MFDKFEFDLQITRITLRSCTTFSVVAARERQEQLSPQFHAIGTGYVLVEDMVSLFSHRAQFGMNHNNALEDFCIWLAKLFENTQQIRGWETKQKLCLKGLWWYYGTVRSWLCLLVCWCQSLTWRINVSVYKRPWKCQLTVAAYFGDGILVLDNCVVLFSEVSCGALSHGIQSFPVIHILSYLMYSTFCPFQFHAFLKHLRGLWR